MSQPAPRDQPAGDYRPRDETQAQRDDRNVAELLQELRITGLGVQVLFGFLLGLPFTVRFAALSTGQRQLYVTCLLLAALSTALLVAPVAYHRLVFRRRQKDHLIRAANVMTLCGLVSVGLAICTAVLLVTSYVDRGLPAVVIAVCTLAVFAGLWFVLPLYRRARADRSEP